MDGFIARENIKHFVNCLQTEGDDHARSTLRNLLLAEEDKFAKLSEKLDILDQNLFRISELSVQQRARIYQLRSDGQNTQLAQRHLANLEDLNKLFVARRRAVALELAR